MIETEATVNSRLLTTDSLDDMNSPLPLSPSNLLTMKSKLIVPPPGVFDACEIYSRGRIRRLLNDFWSRWRKKYLQKIQKRTK